MSTAEPDTGLVDNTNLLINQTIHADQVQKQDQKLEAIGRDAIIRKETENNTKLVMEDLMPGLGQPEIEPALPAMSPEEELSNLSSKLDLLIKSPKTKPTAIPILMQWSQSLGATDNHGGNVIRDRVKKYLAEHPPEETIPLVNRENTTEESSTIDPNERVNNMYRRGNL